MATTIDSIAPGRFGINIVSGWASGEWMLAAANGNGYTAYTRPGQYDVHGILPTEGGGEELTPSVYEQFIAQVVASANAAAEAASTNEAVNRMPCHSPRAVSPCSSR